MLRPLLALLMLACTAPSLPPQDQSLTQAEKDACAAKGGFVGRIGKAQREVCHVKLADAGKVCTDLHQCSGGMCEADIRKASAAQLAGTAPATGQCGTWSHDWFGCADIVIDGKITTRCMD